MYHPSIHPSTHPQVPKHAPNTHLARTHLSTQASTHFHYLDPIEPIKLALHRGIWLADGWASGCGGRGEGAPPDAFWGGGDPCTTHLGWCIFSAARVSKLGQLIVGPGCTQEMHPENASKNSPYRRRRRRPSPPSPIGNRQSLVLACRSGALGWDPAQLSTEEPSGGRTRTAGTPWTPWSPCRPLQLLPLLALAVLQLERRNLSPSNCQPRAPVQVAGPALAEAFQLALRPSSQLSFLDQC